MYLDDVRLERDLAEIKQQAIRIERLVAELTALLYPPSRRASLVVLSGGVADCEHMD